MRLCPHCGTAIPKEKKSNKFCNNSCAASFNNKGVKRHGKPKGNCKQCGKENPSSAHKFCSIECSAASQRTIVNQKEYRRLINREANARYRAKLKNQTLGDKAAIKEFYANCPIGYEVDHIIPISKGGPHSIENLQYLTISKNRKKHNKILI